MKLIAWPIIFAIVVAATATAQPQIAANGVLNAASSALDGWPNSSIAQGSIVSIYGSSPGPSSSPTTAYPLQTTLGGVSVEVSSGGTTLNCIPIFVGPNLVNAILPGNTPTGAATLTITYDGQISNQVSFQVAANSFGIFTVNSNGSGPGVITDANYQLYSSSSPAHPGDTAVIWGTGIGASAGDDGSAPPRQIDMSDLPLSVYVGTLAASVSYRGRAAFTGEDQINFVVPGGISGCYVPVAVLIGNIVSNFVTMPIASSGQSCPDPAMPISTSATGNIALVRSTTIGSTMVTTDAGQEFFGTPQVLAFPYIPPEFGNPYSLPVGTCTSNVTLGVFVDVFIDVLNPGPITITGPNGSQQLTAPLQTVQLGGGSGANAPPLFLSAGAYTASAPGGTQVVPAGEAGAVVGPFSQNFTVPEPLTWTNQGSVDRVERSASLDVTWAGGDPNGTVQIASGTADVGFICNAKTSDQHFTIPTFVLLSVSQTGTSGSFMSLSAASTTPFTATGISSGAINSFVTIGKSVTYQ